MSNRSQPGQIRRELRYSRSAIERNLDAIGLKLEQVKPLTESLMTPEGLLALSGSELLLLEKALGLQTGEPAAHLVGELISVKTVPAGTGVSYGYLHKTSRQTNLGLVAIGFSDGIPRSATNKFEVTIAGKSFKAIGRVAMDQCVIDLGDEVLQPGEEVHFFTTEFGVRDWSRVSEFTCLEILGRITARVSRVWSE